MIIFNRIVYYIFIIPVSLLPFKALYFVADLLYLFLYKVAGYRRSVVRSNLEHSFPNKPLAEINAIEKLFYHHLCDVIVEALKSFTISEKQILKRMVLENPELPNKYYADGRSLILVGGHYNNWEWIATSLNQQIMHKATAIYTPLSNIFFDGKMRNTRGKFGLELISIKAVNEFFNAHKEILTATVFGIDQSPRNPDRCHWMQFLNQDTGVLFGAEKFAKEYNYPVLYCTIKKIKRGYYTYNFSLVTDQPQEEPPGKIIETATKLLERDINAIPQYWLWTHKRWKHKRKNPHQAV